MGEEQVGRRPAVERVRGRVVVHGRVSGEAGAARYAKQGELYCRAVAEALGPDSRPRFEIWWLRSGEIEAIL